MVIKELAICLTLVVLITSSQTAHASKYGNGHYESDDYDEVRNRMRTQERLQELEDQRELDRNEFEKWKKEQRFEAYKRTQEEDY